MAITVKDFLVEHAPQIGVDINQKLMNQPTPWITLYKQEMWEDEKSSVQKTFQFDRAILTDSAGNAAEEVEWANMSTAASNTNNGAYSQADDATGGVPPADYVKYTETIRDFNLQHKALWGPPMNTNNLRDKFTRTQQMGACVKAMADQTRQFWIERKRSEYTRIADNLVVLDSAFSLDGGDYGNMAMPKYSGTDASILTNGFLDEIYEFENFNGGGEGSLGMTENRPVYGLVTSARQSRRLILADPDTREDFRYSSQNEKLLGPMGLKWTYNGFSHICDDSLPRWEFIPASSVTIAVAAASAGIAVATFSGALVDSNGTTQILKKGSTIIVTGTDACKLIVTGYKTTNEYYVKSADTNALVVVDPAVTTFTAWARIPQFVYSSGVGKVIPNPNWLAATWEDSFLFHQDTCVSKVPRPITSVGKASFDAVNYSGEIKWTSYDDKDNNPDGTIGQFRCVLANGTKPLNPEYGIVIRHLAVPRPDGRIMDGSSLG